MLHSSPAQDSPCLWIAFTLHMARKILYLLTYLFTYMFRRLPNHLLLIIYDTIAAGQSINIMLTDHSMIAEKFNSD